MEMTQLRFCRQILGFLIVFVSILFTPGLSAAAQSSKKQISAKAQPVKFGGTYDGLRPAQRRLIDELYRQYNELTKQNLKAPESYDDISLSTRTTFEAVTHALMTTKLTDKQGRPLGTALDVISYVETVHGKIPEARGDLQFRIYVALKPNALQTLEASREFKRGADNTVYHKDYPLNYRQQGKEPTMQISSTKDGKRADIDVDYRSSKFPAAVFNGHLTSANSDVRAGDNYNRHVNRWTGFANWWQSIFGVPLKEADLKEEEVKRAGGIPLNPRSGKGKLEEAMYDFLNSWLVKQQPNQAVAYISPRAYSCIDQVASDEKKKVNPGLVPYYILEGMKKENRALGKPARLADIAQGVRPTDPALKLIDQPHRAEFELFEMPEDAAIKLECSIRNDLKVAEKPGKKSEKYYGASLRLNTPKVKGSVLMFLWTKESDYWKIVSWSVEPDQMAGKKAPSTAAAKEEVKLERVTGDPNLITAVQGFFDEWFVKQNFDKAAGYLSQQCLPCVNLYLREGEKRTSNWTQARLKLLNGMKNIAGVSGRKNEVKETIRSITPAHPDLKLVTHSHEQAYTLVSVPDALARGFECQSRAKGVKAGQKAGSPDNYGNYYGAIFELNVRGEPAAVNLLWSQENDQWKIIAYSLEVP